MLRKKLIVRVLAIAFGGTVLGLGCVAPVMAQSNAAGNIYGRVDTAAGSSILITNEETGLKRTISPDSDGRFLITALPPGRYKVQLSRAGAVIGSQEVTVLVGQGAEASFSSVQMVQVTGRVQKIDVSNTNNGATFTAKQLSTLPVVPSVASIIQLAPNTTRADSRYAAGASFGGGGASENAYYINGFPVTNPLSQLGASELPFGAIAQADILTGGFGAEFGRSVGGVVNITTRSGTNKWELGGSFAITPNFARSKSKDLYYGLTGATSNAATDGTLRQRRSDNTRNENTTSVYVGGPIVSDKLFMFVALESANSHFEGVNTSTASTSTGTNGWLDQKNGTQRYLGKFDWNINDDHRLELTLIGDDAKTDERLSGYDYASRAKNGMVVSSAHYQNNENFTPAVGADAKILKYTGNLSDALTLTALFGKSLSSNGNTYDGYDINQPLFQVNAPVSARAPGLTYNNPQPLLGNIKPAGAKNEVTSMRLDLEYKLGSHTIRGGFDDNKLKSTNAGEFSAGGGIWRYFKTSTPNTPISMSAGPRVAVASGGGLGVSGYYVRKGFFNDATSAQSDQTAQYIEDRYQVTKDILVIGGFRVESFNNKNGAGEKFLEQKKQFAPRLAASWDVNGDASLKVFGSAGRYHIQIPTHIAVRGASASTNTQQFYTYTGVDSNGVPTGLVKLTEPRSANNEFGQNKDAKTVSSTNLKPTFQDELTLGFEKAVSRDLNIGTKITYRTLKSTIDDFCDARPFDAWAARNKVDTSNWRGFNCASFNPGQDNSFLVDFNDLVAPGKSHTLVALSKQDLGFPDPKRTYFAADFFAEHPYRNGWYGKINYTWSKNTGNTEGQTLSDVAQTDVAATQTWDHHELADYTDGLLPNNRTHQIKAYGFYDITPEWSIGGNFLMATGRPKNCIGNYAGSGDVSEVNYGSAYRYCAGVPTPRGQQGTLPTDTRLDFNVVYKVPELKGLSFKMDVFNVFNKQTTQTIDEVYNDQSAVSATYWRTISYTPARAMRFTVMYNKKF